MGNGCRGKIRYATPEQAMEGLRNLATSSDEHPARAKLLNIYRCTAGADRLGCGGWHVGHNVKLRGYRPRRGKHKKQWR